MKEEVKTLKDYARDAMMRLKRGFWQNYEKDLSDKVSRAEEAGVSASKVKEYCVSRITENIRNHNEAKEEFYDKVKKLLDEEGEVSDAIGRLTDKKVLASLDYNEGQRYIMSVSEKYLQAVERYRKEKSLRLSV